MREPAGAPREVAKVTLYETGVVPPRHGGGIGSTRSGTGLRAEGRVNFAENDRPNNEQFGNDHSASLDI